MINLSDGVISIGTSHLSSSGSVMLTSNDFPDDTNKDEILNAWEDHMGNPLNPHLELGEEEDWMDNRNDPVYSFERVSPIQEDDEDNYTFRAP